MIDNEIRSRILEQFPDGETILLDSPSFDHSIIGLTENGRAVYDLDLMVREYMFEDGYADTESEALDDISYNTLRAIGYMGEMSPVIITTKLN